MEASPSRVIEFFNGFKQSVIPLFQRPYTWDKENWKTLWEDISEQCSSTKPSNHFMGAIVTTPAKSVPVGVSKYLVIDGQQRLTTIAILLCAIRDELPEDAIPEKKRIGNHYLVNDGYESWDYFKLLPTQFDREDFKTIVEFKKTNSDKFPILSKNNSSLNQAYLFFRKTLKEEDNESINIRRVLEIIESRLSVVNINLGENDDPYLIFESLNWKGSSLKQADLVRNYLLMRFPVAKQQKIFDEFWAPIEQKLEGDELEEFFRMYLMKDGTEVKKGTVYSVIKSKFQQITEGEELQEELVRMKQFSIYYEKIINPDSISSLNKQLERIKRWIITTSHPLLLQLYNSYAQDKLSPEGFVECLKCIESFAVRREVCRVPTNQLKRIFITLAKNYNSESIVESILDSLLKGTSGGRWPTDDEFLNSWMTYRAYDNSIRCKFILESLEESFEHKETVSFEKATIEHIMPQTLTQDWRKMLGFDKADTVHEALLHTIGNLTLTGYNSELSNSAYQEKIELLTESHYELNKYFLTKSCWTQNEIEQRALDLWDIAKRIWPRPNI